MLFRCLILILLFVVPLNCFALEIQSNSFGYSKPMPMIFTCDSSNISPDLSWYDVPASTKSFAIICDDPDAFNRTWVHWIVFNIPASKRDLSKAIPATPSLIDNSLQGLNDFGTIGYSGPCPPSGKAHRYFFKIYALDKMLRLKPGASKKDLLLAINGHIIAESKTVGIYKR